MTTQLFRFVLVLIQVPLSLQVRTLTVIYKKKKDLNRLKPGMRTFGFNKLSYYCLRKKPENFT